MSKFKVGDVVLYQNGEHYELGIVKEILLVKDVNFKYRVWYHMGDTTAVTDEDLLKPLGNAYAFTILRRSVNEEINLNPCKQFAADILAQFPIYNNDYYLLEEWLTDVLSKGRVADIPIINPAIYYALYEEVRENLTEDDDVDSDTVDEVTQNLMKNLDIIWNKKVIANLIRIYFGGKH